MSIEPRVTSVQNMNKISFPSHYKKALVEGVKNTTIRIGNECGKYVVGKTYHAGSYAGRDWGERVKIVKVIYTTLGKLSEFEIPQRSIESIQKKQKVSIDENVELIKFRVMSR
jgi:hypothetical protein